MWVRFLLIAPAFGLVSGCVEGPGAPIEDAGCSTDLFRITAMHLPRSLAEANQLGFDLDAAHGGDAEVDNQLGALSASLSVVYDGWRPDEALSARLADGRLGWLLAVERCEATPAGRIWLARGEDTDGDGQLTGVARGEAATGLDAAAAGGAGLIPVGYVTDGSGTSAVDVWEEAPGLTVALRRDRAGVVATVGLGLVLDDRALAPAAAFLTDELTGGSRFAASIDTDHDRVVTVGELRASSVARALLAADLDLGGDGTREHLSIGFSVRAVPVTGE